MVHLTYKRQVLFASKILPMTFFFLFAVPDNREVLVNFWNGRTKKVRADQALWIPLPLSERIILELQMPLAARQMLVESSSDYPYVVTPGYRASGHCRHLDPVHCQSDSQVQSYPDCCFLCPSLCHCCPVAWVPIRPRVSRVHSDDDLIPGTSLTKEELSRKIEEQLSKGSTLISEWVSREEEKEEKKGAKEGSAPKDLKSWMEVGSKVTEAKKVRSVLPRPQCYSLLWYSYSNILHSVQKNYQKCLCFAKGRNHRWLSNMFLILSSWR